MVDTLKVFSYDFNDPGGSFVINKNSPDFDLERCLPVVGEKVILISMESRTILWHEDYDDGSNYYDSGFGVVVEVTEIRLPTDDNEYYLFKTDLYQRTYGEST